jgi:type VI secretion system protein ImpL
MKWRIKTLQKKEFAQAQQELKILEDDIAAAYNFLRKNSKGYFGGKKKIPLYLLLGPERFGKTTLLAQAGLNLKNFNNQTLNKVTPTKYCSFWFSQDALYIDTAGTYTKPEITKPRNDLIWQGFIKLLQKYFGKDAISGVLIILDLPAISQDVDLLKKTLFCVRERVYDLAAFIEDLPLHIVFTKCDRILGFAEFFSLLDLEARLQPFGIAFTDSEEKADPAPMFEIKFNELLKNLNERVIERLHKSTVVGERMLIKAFPSQLDSLKQIFIEVIGKIPSGHRISLSGIYFTSSIQDGASIDILKNALLRAFDLTEKQAYRLEASSNHPYFIENIFKKVIVSAKKCKQPHWSWLKLQFNHFYSLLVAVLIVGASCIVGYQSYYKNITTINKVEYFLQQQQSVATNLDDMYVNINKLNKVSKSWWLRFGVDEVKLLQRVLYRKYQASFFQILALELEDNISDILGSPESNIDPKKLYDALQTYLMLGNPKKLDKGYVEVWFNGYWSEVYKDNSSKQAKLKQQLGLALQRPFAVELNQQRIDVARDSLNKMSLAPLVYLILENTYKNQLLKFDSTAIVSKIYTRKYFNEIYNKKIPKIVNNLPQQDWVLGGHLKLQLDERTAADVIKNVREVYIEKYAAAWETTINYKPKMELKNLKETAEDLKVLASDNSPLIGLLQQIKTNTNIDNAPASFAKEIDAKLKGLGEIDISDLQQNLSNLAHHFVRLSQNQDYDKAAFDSMVNYLQNENTGFLATFKSFSGKQPHILQAWLQSIVKDSCFILLKSSQAHVNKAWGVTIVPRYQKMLANKYPLFKDSKDDISFGDFNKFFGPHGLIDDFFNKYIKHFVKTEKTNWTWKNIDGQAIDFSQRSLEVFLRAALIQKMFYSYKTSEPKVKYTLVPGDMTPNTQSFTLHLEGKKIVFTPEEKKTTHLVWPGPRPELVTIDFVNRQGKYFNTSQFGPWALFRVIDKSKIMSTDNTRHFSLTFDLNGNAAKYELHAAEAINPFIPGIINNFRCPDQLN